MWRSLSVGLAIAACSAGVAQAAGGKTVHVPLPAVQAGEVMTFKVVVPGSGAIRVKTANDAALGNLALVYGVGRPVKTGSTSTWTVAVFVKRFTAARRSAGTGGGTVEVHIDYLKSEATFKISTSIPAQCPTIEAFDKGFEGGGSVNLGGFVYTLQNGRTPSEQPSPPEEVMDNVIASVKGCSFTPEGDDPGNK